MKQTPRKPMRFGKKRWRIDWLGLSWLLPACYVSNVIIWRLYSGEWVFW